MTRICTLGFNKLSSALTSRRAWRLLAGALLVAATATALATAELDRGRSTHSTANLIGGALRPETPASAVAQGGSPDKIRVEHVTILPYGFEPDQITRPAGPFLLAIGNRAGTQSLSLQLISERNGPVFSTPLHRGKSRLGKVMDLPPGRYLLIEDSHPQWACTITITAR